MGWHELWAKVPYSIKAGITTGWIGKHLISLYRIVMRPRVIKALRKDAEDPEKKEIVEWLKKNPLNIFPYEYTKKYTASDVEVFEDDDFSYVIYKDYAGNERRIYAPKGWSKKSVAGYFSSLFMEQDKDSPHCYFTEAARMVEKDEIVADFGGAEGIFAIEVIENAAKVYIFECDEKWVEPLKRTFAPWIEKVEIIQRYIGNEDNETVVKMDTFFKDKKIDCIKADIEGAERDMLIGGKETMRSKIKRVFLVGYHKNGDDEMLAHYLSKYGFDVSANRGYIVPWVWPYNFKPPYVRRGVIYGKRI